MRKMLLTAAALSLGMASTSYAAGVTEEDIAADATNTAQVVTNGMGRDLQRYSPLKGVNRHNVKRLVPALSLIHI